MNVGDRESEKRGDLKLELLISGGKRASAGLPRSERTDFAAAFAVCLAVAFAASVAAFFPASFATPSSQRQLRPRRDHDDTDLTPLLPTVMAAPATLIAVTKRRSSMLTISAGVAPGFRRRTHLTYFRAIPRRPLTALSISRSASVSTSSPPARRPRGRGHRRAVGRSDSRRTWFIPPSPGEPGEPVGRRISVTFVPVSRKRGKVLTKMLTMLQSRNSVWDGDAGTG